jgi:(p)ppGpp synthase/HD superfamily hydrolase
LAAIMETLSLRQAEQIAREAHSGQVGTDGAPFIEHPLRVAGAVASATEDPKMIAVALLHDTVEKGGVDWSDLYSAGVTPDIVTAVDAMTQRSGETESSYLARCRADPLARVVKRYDLLDKLQPSYLVRLPEAEADRVARSAQRKLAELEGHAGTSGVEAGQRARTT